MPVLKTPVLSPKKLLQSLACPKRACVALSEGSDPRIIQGALEALDLGLADIILCGNEQSIKAALASHGKTEGVRLHIHDPETSPLAETFAAAYCKLRGVNTKLAQQAIKDPLVYAALLAHLDHADATLGGAVATTPAVVRTALQIIGKAQEAPLVSSVFLMLPPPDSTTTGGHTKRAMLYADAGLVIDPDTQDLVFIAEQCIRSCELLLREEAKIALLSFSTKGSARHACVRKVSKAAEILRETFGAEKIEGELQFDAAFIPEIGQAKAPGSAVAGCANVMIFPNLDAGNIAYKITERLGGYQAIGPILQGLAKPANDLSRGCTAEDVTQMIAVCALQTTMTPQAPMTSRTDSRIEQP